jgi:hypothetical protein
LPSNIYQEVVKTIGHLPPLYPALQHLLLRRVNTTAFDILSKQYSVQIFSAFIREIDALLVAFGKKILVYEYGLIINKENILAPRTITPNKPLDNNKKNYKKRCQTAASLLLARVSTEDIRKVLAPKVYVDPKTKIPEHIHDLLPA